MCEIHLEMTASRVLGTALTLLLLDAPLISADWFGWLGSRASDGLSYVSRAAVELEKNAATLSVDGRALTADEIEEPLLGARLAWLAYATSRRELESGLRRLGGGAELVHFAAQRDGSRPQWFLARIGTTLHVVFRGTDSTVDVLRDLMALPETTAAGDTFHSGFLRGARAVAAEVADALAAELTRDGATCDALHLVGHSLGGALALTLLGAGLLPPDDAALGGARLPPVRVLTYGSPAAFHGRCESAAVLRAKVDAYVYGADLVPRLLGSELPLLRRAALAAGGRLRQASTDVLDTLTEYVHPPHAALVYLDPERGTARRVARGQRARLLHLHQALDLNAAQHHKEYVRGLERASGAAWWTKDET